MKSKDFEVVYASGAANDKCIIDEAYLSSVWEAQLLRARIKNEYRDLALGWLWIRMECSPLNNNPEKFIYDIDVVWTWDVDQDDAAEILLSGSYGFGSEDMIKQLVEDGINDAITKYLKANL